LVVAIKTADEIRGLEYDWLASDADGNVGFFSTAGGGYVPEAVLAETEVFDAAIEAILAAPATTVARFALMLSGAYTNTWQLMAERGVFAFDSDFHGGPYRLLASPEVPVQVRDLSGTAVPVLMRVVLRGLRFQKQTSISTETLALVETRKG
jgi:hypothetical protein